MLARNTAKHGGSAGGYAGGVGTMKVQPKFALLAAAASQAATHTPSAQPWSPAQVSSTWPCSSTTACRSALHDFSTGGASVVLSVPSLLDASPVLVVLSLTETPCVVLSVSAVVVVVVSPAVVASSVALVVVGTVLCVSLIDPPSVVPLVVPLVVTPSVDVAAPLDSEPWPLEPPLSLVEPPPLPPHAATSKPHVVHITFESTVRIAPSVPTPPSVQPVRAGPRPVTAISRPDMHQEVTSCPGLFTPAGRERGAPADQPPPSIWGCSCAYPHSRDLERPAPVHLSPAGRRAPASDRAPASGPNHAPPPGLPRA